MMVAVPLFLLKSVLKECQMEKLTENDPRFCAKYVKNIGIAKEKKLGFYHVFEINGKLYVRAHNLDVNVGDKVWIAKKIKTPNKEWNVHEIVIPEDYWHYEFHAIELPRPKERGFLFHWKQP